MTHRTDMTANRSDLISHVALVTGASKTQVTAIVDATLQAIVELATAHKAVTLREFGRFEVRPRAARVNRSSIGGEPVAIPAREALSFTAAPGLVTTLQADE